jgi:hypothetical protein
MFIQSDNRIAQMLVFVQPVQNDAGSTLGERQRDFSTDTH